LGDRVVKEVPLIPSARLSLNDIYSNSSNIPNHKLVRDNLVLYNLIDKQSFLKLLRDTTLILRSEPNLVTKEGEIVMIGDIHGQFYDMMSMLDQHTPKIAQ